MSSQHIPKRPSPIQSLPAELLEQFFTWCSSPHPLTHVCSFWRYRVLSLPHLWSFIYVPFREGLVYEEDVHRTRTRIEHALRLSKDVELSIHFDSIDAESGMLVPGESKAIEDLYESLLALLITQAGRWGAIYLSTNHDIADTILAVPASSAPRLRTIRLSRDSYTLPGADEKPDGTILFSESLRSLRKPSFFFLTHPGYASARWPNLTELAFCHICKESATPGIFALFPSLCTLSVGCNYQPKAPIQSRRMVLDTPARNRPVVSESLRRVEVLCEGNDMCPGPGFLLEAFHLPVLQEVRLHSGRRRENIVPSSPAMLRFLTSSGSTIRKLDISTLVLTDMNTLEKLLILTPSLEDLTIVHLPTDARIPSPIHPISFWEKLTLPLPLAPSHDTSSYPEFSPAVLAPRLASLTFKACPIRPLPCPIGAILAMIASRRQAPDVLDSMGVRRLGQLRLQFDEAGEVFERRVDIESLFLPVSIFPQQDPVTPVTVQSGTHTPPEPSTAQQDEARAEWKVAMQDLSSIPGVEVGWNEEALEWVLKGAPRYMSAIEMMNKRREAMRNGLVPR